MLTDLPRLGATCDECGVDRARYALFTHPDGKPGTLSRAMAVAGLCRGCHARRVATVNRAGDGAD